MNTKKTLLFTILILLGGMGLYFIFANKGTPEHSPEMPPSSFLKNESTTEEVAESSAQSDTKNLPKKFTLQVPFTPQAPTANWDELHNEACEEASALMAAAYFKGDSRDTLPPEEVETEIQKLTKWQQDKLGYNLSINAEEVARMIEEVYGLKAEVVKEFSEETLKQALVENKLILAPVNGRKLGNPYFQNPGPIYHMFVIKGYDNEMFITNEPGTKRGQDYEYSYKTLQATIGDYDHAKKETVPEKPAVIIVSGK